MTTVYTLQQLLADAGRRQRPVVGVKPLPLKEVWNVLDRYVSQCLEEKRGVVLPNFCRIGWQLQQLRGRAQLRPFFGLAESFCRSYGISPSKSAALQEAELAPMEDFNFSRAAIRFSRKLTKDLVFTGLRFLVQQLGEVCGQNRPVAIEFSFGKLLARERHVDLALSPHIYLMHGLEVPAEATVDVEEKQITFAAPGSLDLKGLNLLGKNMQGSHLSSLDREPDSSARLSNNGSGDGWEYVATGGAETLTLTTPAQGRAGDGGPMSSTRDPDLTLPTPSLVDATESRAVPQAAVEAATPVRPGSHHHVQHAQEDALQRQITALELRASKALSSRAEIDGQHQRSLVEEAQAQAERQERLREHAKFLQRQVEAKENKRRAAALLGDAGAQSDLERSFNEVAVAASRLVDLSVGRNRDILTSAEKETCHGLLAMGFTPATAPLTWSPRQDAQSNELRKALDEQVEQKRLRKEAIQLVEKNFEEQMLAREAYQAMALQKQDEAVKTKERELLQEHWRQENKLRNIQKTIEAIEQGKRMPGSTTASIATGAQQHCLPLRQSTKTESARGEGRHLQLPVRAEARGLAIATPRHLAAPCTARGESLGAVASLTLQKGTVG